LRGCRRERKGAIFLTASFGWRLFVLRSPNLQKGHFSIWSPHFLDGSLIN
jgi:hypothetical protein